MIGEKGETKDEVEKKGDVTEKEEGQDEEKAAGKAGKGSKKRVRGKNAEKVKEKTREVKKKKEKELEPRTPAIDRPVRERKSVERLVASIEKEVVKEFHIEKGPGTALKDIPNVAFKLSRKRTDDTFKLLHTILFGRRGKAFQVKNNISRFSGFVWHDNEEKQKIKIKEKFDKCHKEKLVEICDVLDIPVSKASTRKEDIVAKLIDFLVAPHPTTTVLLAEKEKSSKGSKKRKRVVKGSSSRSGGSASKRSVKNRKNTEDTLKMEDKKSAAEEEDESEEEEEKKRLKKMKRRKMKMVFQKNLRMRCLSLPKVRRKMILKMILKKMWRNPNEVLNRLLERRNLLEKLNPRKLQFQRNPLHHPKEHLREHLPNAPRLMMTVIQVQRCFQGKRRTKKL